MLDFLIGNDLLSAIVAFALVLIPAIIIHELGHFLAAKAVGITILEFGIGFPPRVAKLFTWGETDITLNWLPIGGFVRPFGEDLIRPLSEDEVVKDRSRLEKVRGDHRTLPEETHRADDGRANNLYREEVAELKARGAQNLMSVNEAKPLARIFFMVAGALANFLSAFILFVAIGLIGVPQTIGIRVGLLQIQSGTALANAGLQSGDMIEAVNGEVFQSSAEFAALVNASNSQPLILTVLRPETGEVFDIRTNLADIAEEDGKSVRVLGIASGSPAEGNLLPNDLIVAFNGQTIASADDPVAELQKKTDQFAGTQVTLTVIRDGTELDINLIPRLNPPPDEGKIGISIETAFHNTADGFIYADGPAQRMLVPQSFAGSVQYSFEQIGAVFNLIAEVPGRILRGTITPEEARPISVIGISQWGGMVLQQSIEESQPVTIMNYIAIISILLGITNLLPLPALDGGRIVFVLLEIVRGRPISPEREGLVHLIGFAFILSVGVFFMLNDIINPITNILP